MNPFSRLKMLFKVFGNLPELSPFADGKYWFLRSPLEWESKDGTKVTVPAGFVTDMASIPRFLWVILPPWGRYGNAAIVHDFLYWDQQMSRREADLVMYEGMQDMKVGCLKRFLIYRSLRLFGWVAWRKNTSLKASGKKRILASLPTDPSQPWEP